MNQHIAHAHCEVKASLERVMEAYPTLTDTGFLTWRNSDSRCREEFHSKLKEGRASLLKAINSYEQSVFWLIGMKSIQKINTNAHSYRLKHLAESKACYVSNGTFIAAAIHCGYRMKRCPDSSPNAWFNMSSRSIQERNKHNQ